MPKDTNTPTDMAGDPVLEPQARLAEMRVRLWRNANLRALAGTSGTNALILAINVLTGAMTARLLEPVGRGELAAVILWPQFLSFALALGLPTALIYHLQQRRDDAAELVGTAMVVGLLVSAVGGIVGALLVPAALGAYSPTTVRIAQLCMLFTIPGVLLTLASSVFLQQQQIARFNYVRLAAPVATLVALGALALGGRLTVGAAALAYLVPVMPLSLWAVFTVRRSIDLRARIDRAASAALLGYGLRYYGAELAGTMSAQVDRVVVVLILTPEAMGLYVVALSFSRIFQQIPLSLSTLLLPKVAGRSPVEVVNVIGKAAALALVLSVLMALPALSFGSTLLALFFGPDFSAAGKAFTILTMEALASGCATVLSQAFLAVGRPGRMSLYQGISLVTMVPLLFWWGPTYGIVGISMANLVSTLFSLVFIAWGVYRLRQLAHVA